MVATSTELLYLILEHSGFVKCVFNESSHALLPENLASTYLSSCN